jgi:hypothetical protein
MLEQHCPPNILVCSLAKEQAMTQLVLWYGSIILCCAEIKWIANRRITKSFSPKNLGWARDETHQNQQEKSKESKRRNFLSN